MSYNTKNIDTIGVSICLFIITFCMMVYFNNNLASTADRLESQHYQLAGKVSGIEIKSDDVIRQQLDMVEDIYISQIEEAKDIAEEAGFAREEITFIDIHGINMNTVRLSQGRYDSEIEVNIQSKVITTYK